MSNRKKDSVNSLRKKKVYKPKPMTEGKRNIIQEYAIETAEDIQKALKDLLSGSI